MKVALIMAVQIIDFSDGKPSRKKKKKEEEYIQLISSNKAYVHFLPCFLSCKSESYSFSLTPPKSHHIHISFHPQGNISFLTSSYERQER